MSSQTPPSADEQYQPQWSAWARQFVIIGLVIAVLYALTLLTPVIQVLIATFLFTFLLYVPAEFIAARTRLNFAGGVLVVYLFLFLFTMLVLALFVPELIRAINGFSADVSAFYDTARTYLTNYQAGDAYIDLLGTRFVLDSFVLPLRDLLLGGGVFPAGGIQAPFDINRAVSLISSALGGLVGGVSGLLSTIFLALFLTLLILLDLPNYQHTLFSSIPPAHRREMMILINRVNRVWTGFFRGQLTLGAIIGVLTWLQLVLMGVSQAVTIAIIVALISLIPSIGGIIALVPLALSPLLQGSSVFTGMSNTTFALLVVLVNVVWTQVIWNVVAPKIMGDAVALPLPVIILGIMLGTAVGGILGAFLVVPMMGTLRVILLYLLRKISQKDPFPDESAPEIVDLAKL
ncbi:MAG: AI-2E family transporter [Chloroflexi bacterium]|nr:AI-2E family transporter [Chloroflexota bacterium]